MTRALGFALGGLFLFCSVAQAAEPTSLGKYGNWATYSLTDNGHTVCYMSITAKAPPAKIPSKKIKRGNVVLMITHRPSENTTDVVSYAAGTKFKPSSDANLTIGDKGFHLFTQDDTAWSRDAATDHALAQAIRRHPSLALTGTAATGATLTDTVNLKGADAAYTMISKACGVPVEPLPTPKAVAPKTTAKKEGPIAPLKPQAPEKPAKPEKPQKQEKTKKKHSAE